MTITEFLDTIMSDFLLTLSQSPVLQGIFGFWLLLGLFNRDHRQKLVDNVAFFLRMPLSYDDKKNEATAEMNDSSNTAERHSADPTDKPLYPRRWFEDAHDGLKTRVIAPLKKLFDTIQTGMENVVEGLTWENAMGGIFLAFFIYADIVGGITIISLVPGLIDWPVPVWLGEYSITVVAGTILSVLVSAWMVSHLFRKEASSDTEANKSVEQNKPRFHFVFSDVSIRKTIAVMLLISSFVTILGINLTKLPVFIDLFTEEAKEYIDIISAVFLHVIVMFNAALATFLLDEVGRKGLNLLTLIVIFPLFVVFGFVYYVFDFITSLGPIFVDVVVRIVFVVMNVLAFYVLAPIDLGVDIFSKRRLANKSS
jgi:hypothetical protein